jgi:hypothetical protein
MNIDFQIHSLPVFKFLDICIIITIVDLQLFLSTSGLFCPQSSPILHLWHFTLTLAWLGSDNEEVEGHGEVDTPAHKHEGETDGVHA